MDADAPGYPRRRALPARLGLHLRELARLGPVGAWHHLRERLAWYAARHRGERERLFDDEIGDSAVARAMQASADAMLEVWRAFEPGRPAGRMPVIRAARRGSSKSSSRRRHRPGTPRSTAARRRRRRPDAAPRTGAPGSRARGLRAAGADPRGRLVP